LIEVAAEVEALGRRALVVQTDVRFEEQIINLVEKTLKSFGRIDILINNAGALFLAPMVETPTKRFDLVMSVNARATFILSREVLPHMIERKWGHIVNMSPPIRTENAKGKVGYIISKYGMSLITYGLAAEVREHNIAVHSLWPATAIETAATIKFGLGKREQWRTPEILSDATLGLVSKDPGLRTGTCWIDEEVLREDGVTDFTGYACVPGHDLLRLDFF